MNCVLVYTVFQVWETALVMGYKETYKVDSTYENWGQLPNFKRMLNSWRNQNEGVIQSYAKGSKAEIWENRLPWDYIDDILSRSVYHHKNMSWRGKDESLFSGCTRHHCLFPKPPIKNVFFSLFFCFFFTLYGPPPQAAILTSAVKMLQVPFTKTGPAMHHQWAKLPEPGKGTQHLMTSQKSVRPELWWCYSRLWQDNAGFAGWVRMWILHNNSKKR